MKELLANNKRSGSTEGQRGVKCEKENANLIIWPLSNLFRLSKPVNRRHPYVNF